MIIKEEQIAEKKLAGVSGKDSPVLYIVSKGGLHAFFTKKDGQIESLGAAPHKAIAMWMAEKRDPELKWNKEFLSKTEYDQSDLAKSIKRKFEEIRVMFFDPIIQKSENISEEYTVYDYANKTFLSMNKSEIIESVINKSLDKLAMVRPSDFSGPVKFAQDIYNESKS